jgi:uncharacterized protein (DUF885 family)
MQDLFDEDWAWELMDNPEAASQYGYHDIPWKEGSYLQDVSPEGYEQRRLHHASMAKRAGDLMSTSGGALSSSDVKYLTLFMDHHREVADNISACPLYLLPFNSIGAGGVCFSFLESIEWMRLKEEKDFKLLLHRIRAFPLQIDQFIRSMREGIVRGYVANTAMYDGVIGIIDDIIAGGLPEVQEAINTCLSSPFSSMSLLLEEGKKDMSTSFTKVKDFLLLEYKSHVRSGSEIGCSRLPCGIEGYNACLRYHTTTSLTASDVHRVGQEEVLRIKGRYVREVLVPLGYGEEEMDKFIKHVREDPAFYTKTSSELLSIYHNVNERIALKMNEYFKEIPQSKMEVVGKDKGKQRG